MNRLKYKEGDQFVVTVHHTVVSKGMERTGYILDPLKVFIPVILQDALVPLQEVLKKKESEDEDRKKISLEQEEVRGKHAGTDIDNRPCCCPGVDDLHLDPDGVDPVRLVVEVKRCCSRCRFAKIEVQKGGIVYMDGSSEGPGRIEEKPTVVGCVFRSKCADFLFSDEKTAEGMLLGGLL